MSEDKTKTGENTSGDKNNGTGGPICEFCKQLDCDC